MWERIIIQLATAAGVMLSLVLLFNGIGVAVSQPWWWFGVVEIVVALLILIGTALAWRSPRYGATLIALGAIGGVVFHYWMAPIGIPLAVLLVAGAVLRVRGRRRVRTASAV
jgi:hypothetical protein